MTMSVGRFSRAAAELALEGAFFSKDPEIKPSAVASVRSFLIDYDIIRAREAPPVDKLYTNEFIK
ncbi:MAG: hypothetical protein V3S39_11325 [Thermodesulfobacteriota bacterium]